MRREVHNANAGHRLFQTIDVRVTTVPAQNRFLRLLLNRLFRRGLRGVKRVVVYISFFLGPDEPLGSSEDHCAHVWWTTIESLCSPGHARKWQSTRSTNKALFKYSGVPGSLAQITNGPFARALVLVLEDRRRIIVARLLQDFDLRPSWHEPIQNWPVGCYHIV